MSKRLKGGIENYSSHLFSIKNFGLTIVIFVWAGLEKMSIFKS